LGTFWQVKNIWANFAKVGSSELHKRVTFVVVITVVSLLFPES